MKIIEVINKEDAVLAIDLLCKTDIDFESELQNNKGRIKFKFKNINDLNEAITLLEQNNINSFYTIG